MKKVVIASACRTAIGKFGGTLANVPAAELGSIVIKEALERAHVAPEQVDHVYMGCVIQAGLGQNVARQASLKAGLPIETPAVTVNVVCGSGLNCVNMAAQMIEAGDADIVVAGGMENMDMAPFAMMKGRYGYRMGAPMGKSELVDTMVNDALWDATGFNKHMGMTAENVCTNETYQKKYGYNPITREELDQFSYNSQVKADKAIKDGAFKDEIVPVVIKGKKGDTVFDTDEGPRLTPVEKLGTLKPAFTKDGIVTAGNSSAINDGAAALVIMSEEKAKELGVKPLATWVAGALAGVEPEVMGLGPIAATKKVMAKTGMETAEIISGVVKETGPDVLIVVDALAARSTRRLNRTIQITNTGIQPGSGVGNHRNALTQETLGVPVIAIGIPTVVDAATIVGDALEKLMSGEKEFDAVKYMGQHRMAFAELNNMYMTGKDIDSVVKRVSYTVSEGINIAMEKSFVV